MRFLDYVSINPKISLEKERIYPFVEMGDVSTSFRNPDKVEYKSFDSGVKFADGDTVIARITPCLQNGKRFYCKNIGKGFGSTEYLVFRPKDSSVDNLYLYYFMNTDFIKESMVRSMVGATGRQRVNNDVFSRLDVTFPNIEIQRRIAEILSTYDDLIENNRKQIKLLEEAAQRLYKEWFVDLRFPGYEDTPIVDGVPEGWGKAPIDSRISLLSGYAFKSAQFDSSGEYKIVTIKNVKDGEFDGIDTNRIVSIPGKMPKHCVLADRDILLSLTGNVGRTCIVNGNNYLLNQRVAKLQSDIPAFTYCLFRSSDMFDAMNNLANGAAQQNLSPIRTGKISILFPADNLLEEFERIVGSMISKMLSLRKQCDLLIQARDRLLPKLMSGEIEV